MKKRIVIFSTAYHPFIGGAEVAIKEITDRLGNKYEFDMVTALMDKNLPRTEQVGNITVHRVGFGVPKIDKLYLALFGYKKGLSLHKQKKYDAVWAMMASFGGFAAAKFKEITKIKYLLTLQEGDPIEEILAKVKNVKKKFIKIFALADALQAISNYLFNWGKTMGFKGSISEVVPNGVDVDKFTANYSQEKIIETRKEFGFPENSKVVVTASRLVKKNGIADVIKALDKLPQNICFYICGNGDLEPELKKLSSSLGLEPRIKFAGFKQYDELPLILKSSDVFIRPSLTEGLGNSFLEAMAAGIPTIGTLVGGIPDFLEDGITGIVCEPENIESIADAINKAVNLSNEEKELLYKNAMQIINNKYNWEYVASRMDNMFNNLIQNK